MKKPGCYTGLIITLPYQTIPHLTKPYRTLPYLPYHTSPYRTVPNRTIPYRTLPYHICLIKFLSLSQWQYPNVSQPF